MPLQTKQLIDNVIHTLGSMTIHSGVDECGVHDFHNAKRYYSGSHFPLFNGVFNTEHDIDTIMAYFPEMMKYFQKKEVPFVFWWLNQDDVPDLLAQHLSEWGLQSPGVYSSITVDLNKFDLIEKNDNVAITQVMNDEDYQTYIDILCETSQVTDQVKQEFHTMLNHYGDDKDYQHYLGYLDGQPVGTVTACINDNIVGLYNGATTPDARKQGVLTAGILQAIEEAQTKGCQYATAQLMAGDMAGNACEKLGFERKCQLIPYIYGVNADSLEP